MQRKKALSSFIHLRVGILSVLISFCMTAAFAQQSTVKGKVDHDQILGLSINFA